MTDTNQAPIVDAIPMDETQVVVRNESEVSAYTPEASPTDLVILSGPYIGASIRPFDEKVSAVLADNETVPDEDLNIKPNGQIYLSHTKARHILNRAFGYGGWSVVPVGDFRQERTRKEKNGKEYEHVILYRTYRMYCHGRFVAEVESSGDYYTNNAESNYGDAAEACQSYAINRLCKPFGIASQCWDKAYGERWKKKYAFQRDGKWYKRDLQVSGAGQAGGEGSTRPEKARTTTHSTPQPDLPSQQPSDIGADDAMLTRPADRPASGNDVTNNMTHIRVKKVMEKKGSADKVRASVQDTTGKWWMFHGGLTIAVAEAAKDSGEEIEITYDVVGDYFNVRTAVWPERESGEDG